MARLGSAHLLLEIVILGLLGASAALPVDNIEFPTFETSLGSKLALADDYYDSYVILTDFSIIRTD